MDAAPEGTTTMLSNADIVICLQDLFGFYPGFDRMETKFGDRKVLVIFRADTGKVIVEARLDGMPNGLWQDIFDACCSWEIDGVVPIPSPIEFKANFVRALHGFAPTTHIKDTALPPGHEEGRAAARGFAEGFADTTKKMIERGVTICGKPLWSPSERGQPSAVAAAPEYRGRVVSCQGDWLDDGEAF